MAGRTNLYVGTDRGLWVCRRGDASRSWVAVRRTLDNRTVLQVVPSAGAPNHVAVLARGDGVFYSPDNGQEWMLTLPAAVTCLLSDMHNPARLYAGMSPRHTQSGAAQLGPVMISTDGGQIWAPLADLPGISATTAVLTLALARLPPDQSILWAGLNTGGVLATYDQGTTWQWRRIGLDLTAPVRHLAVLRARHAALYAAGASGIYYLDLRHAVSGPLGATVVWRRYDAALSPDGPRPGPDTPRQVLALGRGVYGAVLLATDVQGVLWYSDQPTTAWRRINTGMSGLPVHEMVTTLLANPFAPDSVLLGTASGQVYESNTRGAQWVSLGFDAGAPVRTLALERT